MKFKKSLLFNNLKHKDCGFSKQLLKIFIRAKGKRLIKINNGDHSLSRKNDLNKICYELDNIIKNC